MQIGFSGGCLCGSVRYVIERRHLNAMNCYCSQCRKAHGTAFSTHVLLRADQFVLLQGESVVEVFASSEHGRREYCRQCGSHVLVHGQTRDGAYAVPAGTLDGNPAITLVGHIFVADKVDWYHISDDLPQHTRWPPGVGSSNH